MSQKSQKATYQLVPHDIEQAASVGGFNSTTAQLLDDLAKVCRVLFDDPSRFL
jgi:hypothetical protein